MMMINNRNYHLSFLFSRLCNIYGCVGIYIEEMSFRYPFVDYKARGNKRVHVHMKLRFFFQDSGGKDR